MPIRLSSPPLHHSETRVSRTFHPIGMQESDIVILVDVLAQVVRLVCCFRTEENAKRGWGRRLAGSNFDEKWVFDKIFSGILSLGKKYLCIFVPRKG